ncbi:MAG TPA: glycosyltransferase [Flavobacterium sp.]|jgi:glycosyltransferase involved in cell wall biosynthesis
MLFSLIIPVFNRPDEVKELLESLQQVAFADGFEVVIIEDGSTLPCKEVVAQFQELSISYYFKPNSGPGDSRNYGMQKAKGDYFIIFDSDCIIPKHYLTEVQKSLSDYYVDCFGGPDQALDNFSNIQKAINFAMTSIMTTGGIRGASEKLNKFQPRSFNMGLSRIAFEKSGGFGNIHPGEDPDLSIRLWNLGFETRLFPSAYVYHKRRIDWSKFYKQVNKFGKARPILNSWYPKYSKPTFFFPTVFILGFGVALISVLFGNMILLSIYCTYFILLFVLSLYQNKNLSIAVLSLLAVGIQFYGYGLGFLKSFLFIQVLKKDPKEIFPELFFK